MYQNNRTEKRNSTRMPYSQECFLVNESFDIKSQTVDVSKMGLRVLVNGSTPFEKGDKVFVHIKKRFSQAQVRWMEKVNNDATRLGLKLSYNLGLHF